MPRNGMSGAKVMSNATTADEAEPIITPTSNNVTGPSWLPALPERPVACQDSPRSSTVAASAPPAAPPAIRQAIDDAFSNEPAVASSMADSAPTDAPPDTPST